MTVELRDVTFTYPGSGKPALDEVSLSVDEGCFALVIGTTGSGKSTLAELLVRRVGHAHVVPVGLRHLLPPVGPLEERQGEDDLRLDPVLALLAADPASLTSVREPRRAWKVHVEDSLSGLELVGSPARLADVGAGAGFPGLVLAAALPATRVDLIESVARKCEFMRRATAAALLA